MEKTGLMEARNAMLEAQVFLEIIELLENACLQTRRTRKNVVPSLAYINQHEGRHRSIVFQDTSSPFQCTCRRHLLLPPQYLEGCHKREQEEGNTNGRHAAGNYENNATSPDLGSHDREIYIQPPLQIRANTCTVADSIYLTFGAHKVALVNAQARRKRTQGPAFRVC